MQEEWCICRNYPQCRQQNCQNSAIIIRKFTGNLADLEAAITAFQQAIQAAPPDSLDRPRLLGHLGIGLQERYERTGNLADLEAAITAGQLAVQATPPDSPDQPRHLGSLGVGLQARYERTGNVADLEAAIITWEKSWSVPHLLFAAFPVAYQLGQQRLGTSIAALLVRAYLERTKQIHPRSLSVPRRALEIAEGSKSRLLTQLVGRGPLSLSSELPQEIVARERKLLADLTALDTQELAIHDHLSPIRGEQLIHL